MPIAWPGPPWLPAKALPEPIAPLVQLCAVAGAAAANAVIVKVLNSNPRMSPSFFEPILPQRGAGRVVAP
ncbi:hypothetical protein GCM10023325_23670 [Sphingomonas lutea]